jgi:peptidoglycan/LPS O-acetylase OafA/YrhL
VSEATPPVVPPPLVAPVPPPPSPRLTRFDGCLGFFLGFCAGILILMLGFSIGRARAGLIVIAILGIASIVGLIYLAKSHPRWSRLNHAMVIGIALIGLLFGLCNALT